eukprot:UN03669
MYAYSTIGVLSKIAPDVEHSEPEKEHISSNIWFVLTFFAIMISLIGGAFWLRERSQNKYTRSSVSLRRYSTLI